MNPYDMAIGSNGLLQTAPIAPADSNPDMKCGTMGVPGDAIVPLQVDSGASLTVQFLHDMAAVWDVSMNANHHGFCFIYLAPFSSYGEGPVWTKVYSDGYHPDVTADQVDWFNGAKNDAVRPSPTRFVGWWCSDILRYNGGKLTFTLPSSTPAGKYILRAELLTTFLPNTVSTAQSYTGCIALQVGSAESDGTVLPNAVTLPDAYAGAPWIHYDLHAEYPNNMPDAPGPAVWDGSGTAPEPSPAARQRRHRGGR